MMIMIMMINVESRKLCPFRIDHDDNDDDDDDDFLWLYVFVYITDMQTHISLPGEVRFHTHTPKSLVPLNFSQTVLACTPPKLIDLGLGSGTFLRTRLPG